MNMLDALNLFSNSKRIAGTTVFLVAAWIVCFEAQAAVMGSRNPVLVCDEPVYDFGEVANTQTVEHTFVLRNDGEARLEINRVETGCGCTPAVADRKTVLPGESAGVKVAFSLTRRSGRQRQQVKIHSNDPENPVFILRLEGTAVQGIRCVPARLYFGSLLTESSVTRTVEVFADTDILFAVTNVVWEPSFVSVECSEEEPGKRYLFSVALEPPLPDGTERFSIIAETDNSEFPRVEIPVMTRVTSLVFAMPDELVIDADRVDRTSRLFVVQTVDDRDFRVLSVEAPQKEIKVTVTKSAGLGYRVAMENIIVNKELDGAVIKIKTDVQEMPELNVPIRVVGSE